MIDRCILDTNMLYPYFRSDERVVQMVRKHQLQYGTIYITLLTYYEVLRGLTHMATSKNSNSRANARERIRVFEAFCQQNTILMLTEDACRYAATIFAKRKWQGQRAEAELDILIAGIALANACTLITENVADFQGIDGLEVVNWLALDE